jgi:bifunctional non-homologous end joining protein LigD
MDKLAPKSRRPPATKRAKRRPKPSADPLAGYRAKRDFAVTAEPAGRLAESGTGAFVVQKHDATRLHYDFRLGIDGVLKSWAVPKGVPLEPGERRLAVMVEDHPMDYGSFEGIIPAGEYGGGTVMLWDRGTFAAEGGDASGALSAGKLNLQLRGEKLQGEWTLVRLRATANQWLLIKTGKALHPKRPSWDRSVATRRTLEEIGGRKLGRRK